MCLDSCFFISSSLRLYFVFFFFQAEDGIRDLTVTGVQTCALPISRVTRGAVMSFMHKLSKRLALMKASFAAAAVTTLAACNLQDRRVTGPSLPSRDRKSVV